MYFILTESGVKNGYGRPLKVFYTKTEIQEYIIHDFKQVFGKIKNYSIKTYEEEKDIIDIIITGFSSTHNCNCKRSYCLFIFDKCRNKDVVFNFFKDK